MLLVVEEEETLVPPDGSAHCSAELIAVQPAGLGQEKVASVKYIVAPKLEERAVKAVGARLSYEADLAEGRLPQFRCIGVGLHLELLDGVDGGPDRDVAELAGVVVGAGQREVVLVVSSPDGDPRTVATGSNGSGIDIGGRDNQNNFTLAGANNHARQFGNIAIRPSIDAIQEFKVQTNSYTAELGQAAFGQISLITKSGTNSFHGALFEFWRNNVFDARNFFLPKPSRLNRNQFGGAVGGPIWRNKSFFFFNYEQHTERRGVESLRSVPFQAWRDGDFSAVPGLVLKDPSTGQPLTGNRIPLTMFSKTAKAAIGLWPQQNFGGATTTSNNLLVTAPDRFSDGLLTVKIDHELTSKDRLSGRYSRAPHDETT